MIFRNRRKERQIKNLLKESMHALSGSKTLPEEACPVLRELLQLTSMRNQAMAVRLMETQPRAMELLDSMILSLNQAITMSEAHLVEHLPEGDLTDLMPDSLAGIKEWGQK